MKKLLIILTLIVSCSMSTYSQISRSGDNFRNTSKECVKKGSSERQTKYTYTDSDGKTYPIFVGKTGSCYIKRVSQKSGKEYKKYLGKEISSTICKELGIIYKGK
jgi:hypothetical protein